MAEDTTLVHRLMDKLEEMGRSITRIEEQVKPIGDIKKDVDTIKVDLAKVISKADSAHHRLDSMEDDIKELPTRAEHTNHGERIQKLERVVYWVGGLIIGAVILAWLGLVIVEKTQ